MVAAEKRNGASAHLPPAGLGHNNPPQADASPKVTADALTVFEQFEAIVDAQNYTAEQKCILVKVRCRVDSKTKGNAIVSNEGLMRAASLKDPRALRAEMRDLQGKTRDLPEERDKRGRPIKDPIDEARATIALQERDGRASVIRFTAEQLQAINAAYLRHREQKRGPGRPPLSGKPPASHSEGLGQKPPASGTEGLEKPPASHAENPLRQTHPDPFPLSGRQKEGDVADATFGADAPPLPIDDCHEVESPGGRKRSALRRDAGIAFDLYVATAERCGLPITGRTDGLLQKIGTRLREGGLECWQTALAKTEQSAFLCGDRGWRLDLFWLVKPDNFEKVRSGKYDNRRGNGLRNSPTTESDLDRKIMGEERYERYLREQKAGGHA